MQKRLLAFVRNNWLVILLAILPIVVWFLYQRERRSLQITLLRTSQVIRLADNYENDVDITYKGVSIDTLTVIDLEIRNTGNRPITPSQFEIPIQIMYRGRLAAKPAVVASDPSALRPNLGMTLDFCVSIAPLLLNPGDHFIVSSTIIDLDTTSDAVEARARIEGVPDVAIEATVGSDQWLLLRQLLATLSISTTAAATVILVRRYKNVRIRVPRSDSTIVAEGNMAGPNDSSNLIPEGQLAKSEILLMRIRIEEQLQELAALSKLSDSNRIRGVQSVARSLAQCKTITTELADAVHSFASIANRELHASQSYMTGGEHGRFVSFSNDLLSNLELTTERLRNSRNDATA